MVQGVCRAGLRVELAFPGQCSRRWRKQPRSSPTIVRFSLHGAGTWSAIWRRRWKLIRKRHAHTAFRVTPALGDAPEIVAAITERVKRAMSW